MPPLLSKGVPGKGAPSGKGAPAWKGQAPQFGKGMPGIPKGLGKGGFKFQGSCWKSGVWGRRSFECPNASMIQGVETGDQEGAE
eukprot:2219325-Karenia_brevis.AAC.1